MTRQEALLLIEKMKIGKKYFWNKASGEEGVTFELFFIERNKCFIAEGFQYFDYEKGQDIDRKLVSFKEFEGKLLTKNFGARLIWAK